MDDAASDRIVDAATCYQVFCKRRLDRARKKAGIMSTNNHSERRKQLVRTMNDLGDLTLKIEELAKGHLDNVAAVNGLRQAVTSIKATRDVLQLQYNELLSGRSGG